MKKLFILPMFCLMAVMALAQTVDVKRSDYDMLRLEFHSATPTVEEVTLFGDTYSSLSMPNAITTLEVGHPALPMMTKMVQVPLCEGFSFELSNVVADTIDGSLLGISHAIMPAQPSRSKSDRSEPVLAKDQALYATNAFTGSSLFSIEKVGVARSVNLASVKFCPIQYNPVSGQLIVVKSATVTVTYKNADITATQQMAQRYGSPAFGVQTLNALPSTKDIASAQQAPIHYLIVAHSMFRGELDEFIAWKQRKGFLVTVGYTDDPAVGTTSTAIAAWVKGFYTNATADLPAPTYLLIVGDHQQVPAFDGRYSYYGTSSGEHVTDLYYTTWTTGDNIPDCYCGRFSAQNISQLTPQIEKTLMYEQYTFADPSFLSRGILVAGVDSGSPNDNAYKCADPAMDYIAKEYIKNANGYTTVSYYKNNTSFAPAGVTVTGSSQTTASQNALKALYSQGAGWINYSAHGDVQEWYKPNFTNSDINAMTNTEKFGLVIGSCCLTNKFDENTCFGEAWLRKGNYCGAVGYIGGSNSTYWYEDFYWGVGMRSQSSVSNTMDPSYTASALGSYDRMFHTHGETRDQWYVTTAGLMMAGNLAVESSSSSGKNYYWEIYHLMGDPSIMPWLGQAAVMDVSASTTIPLGTTSYAVQAVPYAYCALTDEDGSLVGAAFADASGNATIDIASLSAPGTFELAVSAQNYQTAFLTVDAIVLNGPFVKVNSIAGTLVAGTQCALTVEIENAGTEATQSLSVELMVDGHHLFLNNAGQQTVGNLNPEQTATISGVFSANVLPTVADQTSTPITAIVRWGNHADQVSRRTLNLSVAAPRLNVESSSFNGTMEPGNTVTLSVVNTNSGHVDALGFKATLLCIEPTITIANPTDSLGAISTNRNAVASFSMNLAADVPQDSPIPLRYILDNGSLRYETTLYLPIGSGAMEDFESGSLTTFTWEQGEYAWEITSSEKYAGTYSARSRTWNNTGWYGEGSNKTSEMSISWTSTVDDSISFLYKVSSETNYDWFRFYIDGSKKMQASGEEGWTRVSFPVSAGNHVFRFAYEKDYSQNDGSDCVWIDNITFPLAGVGRNYNYDTVCRGEVYQMPTYAFATDSVSSSSILLTDTTSHQVYLTLLTISDAPNLHIDADHPVIRSGESALITLSGCDSYLWNTGETVSQLRVYPTQTTTYVITGYSGRCSTTDSITITVSGSIGITPTEAEAQINAYPNPTSGVVTLTNLSTEPLLLYDMTGKIVLRVNDHSAQHTLNLQSLPQGVYILRNGSQVKKVVRK